MRTLSEATSTSLILLYFPVYENSSTPNFSPFQPNFHVSSEGEAEFVERGQVLVDGGNFGVSTVAFDTYEELLWMGNQGVSGQYFYYQIGDPPVFHLITHQIKSKQNINFSNRTLRL